MIDVSKPLQLADGTPVEFVRVALGGSCVVRFPDGTHRYFDLIDGANWWGPFTDLQNVPAESDSCVRNAAPDLLAALKKLYGAIDSCVELTPELLAECRAVIARAEGEA